MTRAHRTIHRLIWPVLALLIAFGFSAALYLRPPPDNPASSAVEETG